MSAFNKFSLRPINSHDPSDELVFQYNPEEYEISNAANYVETGVSQADFQNDYGQTVPFRWNGNAAGELNFTTIFDARNLPNNIPPDQLANRITEVNQRDITKQLS